MSDTPSSSAPHRSASLLFGGLYFEICVLIFCAAILGQTGKTTGPVFDVVGPDFLPTAVAWIVGSLTVCQILVHLVGWRRGRPDLGQHSPTETATGRLVAAAFGLVTIVYAAALSNELLPFYAATAAYLLVSTMLLARR